MELHGTTVDGMTLAQRVKEGKRKTRESGSRLGSGYWSELRAMYSSGSWWAERLKVQNASELVQADLVEALRHAGHPNVTKRTKAPLLHFLQSVGSINQRELCGLMRHIMQVRPSSSVSASSLVVEVMKMIVRLDLHTTWRDTVVVGAHLFDDCLSSVYATMKKEGVPASAFWEVHGGIASLILAPSDVMDILAEKSNFMRVSEQIKRVVASSTLGSKMFSVAASDVYQEEFSATINTALGSLPKATITMKDYTDFNAKLTKKLGDLSDLRASFVPRTISVTYRNIQLEIETTSPDHEIEVRVAACLKGMAAGGHLPLLPMEEELLPEPDQVKALAAVSAEVVREWKVARLACKDFLAQTGASAELCKDSC